MSKKLDYIKAKSLLNRLVAILQKEFADEVLSVALYGSVARGQASLESDIDLLIIYKKGRKRVENDFVKVLLELRETPEYLALRKGGFFPDVFPLFLDEVKLREHPWILLDIMEEGVILLDKENILKNELELLRERLKLLGAKKVILADGSWYWDLKPDWQPGDVIKL